MAARSVTAWQCRRAAAFGLFSGGLKRSNLKQSAGFTLVEVLVATMVLSLVIFLATFSYSLFLNTWEKKSVTNNRVISDYRSHVLVRAALESIYDYYITDPENERNGRHYPYFNGEKKMIEFVTLSSIFNKGVPAAARLRLECRDGADRNYCRLIYEETSLEQRYIRYADDKMVYDHTLIVYSGLEKLNFRYYGQYELKWNAAAENYDVIRKWQETFSGEKRNTIPEIIEVTLDTGADEITLLFPIRACNAYKKSFFNRAF